MTLARDLDTDVEAARRAKDYLHALQHLETMRDPAEIAAYRIQVREKIAENSEELWMCWLRIQPSKLDQQGRQLPGEYAAILRLMAAGGDGQGPGRQVYSATMNCFRKCRNTCRVGQ